MKFKRELYFVLVVQLKGMVIEKYCYKCITFGCEFFKCFSQKDGSAKSSTSLIAIPVCIRIGTFINMLIQIHRNLLKNNFTPNIVHSL